MLRSMTQCRPIVALVVAFVVAITFAPLSVQAEGEGAAGWSAPSTAKSATQVAPFDAQSSALRMIGGLFLCLGMFGFALHVYRRYVLPRTACAQRRLQLVERLQISQKSALVLVKLDGKEFIISTGSEASRLVPLSDRREDLFDETLNGACAEVGEYNA